MPPNLVILLLPQNWSGSKPIAYWGLWSMLADRQNTLLLYLPVVLAFWRHTSLISLPRASPSFTVRKPQAHMPLKTLHMSPSLQILLSHGVRLPHQPYCPGSPLQMLLFCVILATKPMPQPEVWPGLVIICQIYDHPATLGHPLFGAWWSLRRKSELAL